MKIVLALLATLFCAACEAAPKEADWIPVVTPYDTPTAECTKPLPKRPRPPLTTYTGQTSSDQYKKLANSYDDLSADYKACQTWAKGQR